MRELQQFADWFRGKALPLWAGAGFDAETGVFAERLGFDCRPVAGLPHRLMVQARQVAVFSDAGRLGWMDGAGAIAARAAETMIATYKGRGDKGGWAFSAHPGGRIADARADLYTHAFVLYALSRLRRLDAAPRWRELALETASLVDTLFAHPAGGHAPGHPAEGRLLQNPVMHLLEAMLDLAESCGDDVFTERAGAIRRLALDRFIDPQSGALHERFDAQWNSHGPGADSWIEPGHLHEWIWLLDWSERVLGGDMAEPIAGLYRFAAAFGHDGEGFLVDELAPAGEPRKTTRRLWPHTEALRAELVLARRKGDTETARAPQFVVRLGAGFLAGAPPGGWIDRIDAAGKPLSPDMPASSLYHLAGAAAAIGTHLQD